MLYPNYLKENDTIGVPAPSDAAKEKMQRKLISINMLLNILKIMVIN